MNGAIRALLVIAFVALVTFFTRLLPFVLFPEGKETPPYVKYLGKVLPFAIIAMLMVVGGSACFVLSCISAMLIMKKAD